MSWHYSRALEEAYSEANCSDGEPSVLSNGMPMHGTFWSPDKTMDASTPSRSGMTYKPLTEDHGEDVLTWCLEASLAKTSVALEKAQVLMVNAADYGLSSQESLAKLDLDTSSWKTHQQSLFEGLEESLTTFLDWGSMQNGELFPPKMSAVLKNAKDFGRLRHSIQAQQQSKQMTDGSANGAKGELCLDASATMENGSATNAENGHTHFIMMNGTVARTAAPKMWLTPQANEDAAGTPNGNMQKMLGNHPLIRGTTPEQWKSGTLNPMWIEWLMGFPLGWTDCDASAMPRFQQWQHSHGAS